MATSGNDGGSRGPCNGDAISNDGARSRTLLWCVPRSGSTALTKCLTAVEGLNVWFEPFVHCLEARVIALGVGQIDIPPVYEGNEEIFQRAAAFLEAAVKLKPKPEHLSIMSLRRFLEEDSSQHVLVKDMGQVMMGQEDFSFFPKGYRHAFLIRHPLRVFASYRKAMFGELSTQGMLTGEAADEKTFDIGRHVPWMNPSSLLFKDMYTIWKYVRENLESDPIVIDGDDLMSKPAEVLPKYCRAIGIPYDESMLKWDVSTDALYKWVLPASGLVESFAHVYGRATTSSEFYPPLEMPKREDVTPDVLRCADEMMTYYDEMYATRI